MDQLIELLTQIEELAAAGREALQQGMSGQGGEAQAGTEAPPAPDAAGGPPAGG